MKMIKRRLSRRILKTENNKFYYLIKMIMKIPLAPIFKELWIDKMTSPEEIDKVISDLRSDGNDFSDIPDSMGTPVTGAMKEWFDKYNKVVSWEMTYDEAFPNE